eukprot:Pgem_evm1s885
MIDNLLVFDFDRSLINENSDTYVIKLLDKQLYKKIIENDGDVNLEVPDQWTDKMNFAVKELHKNGTTKEQLENCLSTISLDPAMLQGLKFATETKNSVLAILSDANTVYIDVILK